MATLCIGIFLFSYVNATMFWHGHSSSGYWYFHSHISGAAHRSAPADTAHTTAELLLIQTLNLTSFTDDVIPACDLVPFRQLSETVLTTWISYSGIVEDGHVVLRGPPALV